MAKAKKDELDPALEKLSFEESLETLEWIMDRIEQGVIGLEDSLSAYKEKRAKNSAAPAPSAP